jgi:RNA polymerase sigma factor (TIGR02999 family)
MTRSTPGTITRALNALGSENADATSVRLAFDVIYAELRFLAKVQLDKEFGDRTIQPTVLVHEAYMKLLGKKNVTWDSRAHFFGSAANAMRQILVDEAKKRKAVKNGNGTRPDSLRDDSLPDKRGSRQSRWGSKKSHDPVFWVELDKALKALDQHDPRMAQVVALRFFAGLDFDAIARALDLSERTILREWNYARAWLRRRLGEDFLGDE